MRKKRMVCALFLAALLLPGGMLSAAGAMMTVADGYVVEYDTIDLNMMTTAGAAITSGQSIGAATGRLVMQVAAKTTTGDHRVTVKSANGTMTQGVDFKVVESTLPLTVSRTNVVLDPLSPQDLAISGGQPPYAAVSGDPTIVTASVSGSTLTLTPVRIGGPVNIVVTDGAGGQATVPVSVTIICQMAGGDVGIESYTVGAASRPCLMLNISENGVNPPASLKQEWLVFGAIVNGVHTPYFFLTTAGQVVELSDTTDPAAVEYTFNHTSNVQMLVYYFPLSSLDLKAGDTFFYLYAWSSNLLTSFQNASGLTFNNVVILNVK